MTLDQGFPARLLFHAYAGQTGSRADRGHRRPFARRGALRLAGGRLRLLPPPPLDAGARTLQGGRIGASDRRQGRAVHRPPATFASDRMALDSDFRNPAWGAALYHESQLRLGRFDLSAGLRIDYERTRLRYLSSTDIDCTFGDGTHHALHRTGHAAQVVRAAAAQSGGRLPHRRRQFALRIGRQGLQGGRIQHPDVLRKCCRTASWNAWASTGTVTTTSTAW